MARYKKYSFVMNDRFCGIPAPVASALQDLWKVKELEYAGAIGAKELLKFFMELPTGERQDLIGGVPAELPEFVEASAVGELLSYLADNPSFSFGCLSGKAPDFDEKAEYNGLSEYVKKRIEVSSYQAFLVDDFLEADSDLKQSISEEVNKKYQESKQVISDAAEGAADLRYFWLVESLIPEVSNMNPHSQQAFWSAAELILAKYFESCDVYEDPSHNITS
ncbi:ABC-three component system protein [Halomonas aestuarii]|uniref:ABC-three component system protein n=1 Tax=Halomonas aestuarii TaxID=1897729 RepID=UPI000F7A66D3|nr:ABC-three component system protein [Halomonas aestuarii]